MFYLIPQLAMFGLLGALLGHTGLNPLHHWQWWAWFTPMLVLLHIRDILKED